MRRQMGQCRMQLSPKLFDKLSHRVADIRNQSVARFEHEEIITVLDDERSHDGSRIVRRRART